MSYKIPVTGPASARTATVADWEANANSAIATAVAAEETARGAADDYLQAQITAGVSGLTPGPEWDASSGSFPASSVANTFYTVSVAGTVDSVTFAIGDVLVALTDNASTTTYSGNWVKMPWSQIVDVVYPDVASLIASLETNRGVGKFWTAGAYLYYEADPADPEPHLTTAGGVGLYYLPAGGWAYMAALGLPFDGSVAHDDALDLLTAIGGVNRVIGPGYQQTLRFDTAHTFDVSGPVWDFSGAIVDCSNNTGTAFTLLKATGGTGQMASRFYCGHMVGAGAGTSSVAFVLGDTSGTSSGGIICDGSVNGFGVAVQLGDNGYITTFSHVKIGENGTAVYVPTGLTNAGERITFIDCVIRENTLAFDPRRVCRIHLTDCSVDYNVNIANISGPAIISSTDTHWEWDPQESTAAPFVITDENASIMLQGGSMIGSGVWTQDYLFDNAGLVYIDGMEPLNCRPLIGLHAGDGRLLYGTNSYDQSSGIVINNGQGCLLNGGFESAALTQDLLSILTDTVAVTDRLTGTNVSLSQSSFVANSDTYSLRMAKAGGAGSLASFGIIVPATVGDIFAWSMSVLNNDSRSGNIFGVPSWVRYDGLDANGVPYVGYSEQIGAAVTISPTATWTKFSGGDEISGNTALRCPPWANGYRLSVTANQFVGGAGAAEDGGDYSLYFDDLQIFRHR